VNKSLENSEKLEQNELSNLGSWIVHKKQNTTAPRVQVYPYFNYSVTWWHLWDFAIGFCGHISTGSSKSLSASFGLKKHYREGQ